jgi:uridylate kinase
MGWGKLSNGDLLAHAETAGFDVLITADQSIRYQQTLAHRRIALVVLGSNHWRSVKESAAELNRAVADAKPGTYQHVNRE